MGIIRVIIFQTVLEVDLRNTHFKSNFFFIIIIIRYGNEIKLILSIENVYLYTCIIY